VLGADAPELPVEVAGDLGRGVVHGPDPAAVLGPLPGLAETGGGLAGQLDLHRDARGQGVDVLAVQPRASLAVGFVGQLDGTVRDLPLARLLAKLPLADPPAALGDRGFEGQADHPHGVDVGELRNHERPGADVQADQAQRLAGGSDPQVAKQPVTLDQAALVPAGHDLAQGLLAELAGDLGRAGRQAAKQHPQDVGAGGVLLAQPDQRGHIALGDAGVGVPTGTPRRAGTHPAAVDVGPRP
jgi:hypothetical protein